MSNVNNKGKGYKSDKERKDRFDAQKNGTSKTAQMPRKGRVNGFYRLFKGDMGNMDY